MWLKNSGFYMAELIISLSIWIVISTVFVPIYIQLHNQLIQLEEKAEALHLFYEYIQTVMIENPVRENIVLTKGERQYSIYWDGVDSKEVRICYEDVFGQMVEIRETTP